MTSTKRVWIEQGCIACNWCTDLLPSVFTAGASGFSVITADSRKDGRQGTNRREKSPLSKPLQGKEGDFLGFVADGCPARVIRFDG